ncbi:hypothetical protein [Candidatus Palauibacter sp.]|uniref:hypothetical protein n=1 Tax=Candidatus Palauibacter sp. TaxID=3101350 RepID=UPI003C6EAD50
MTTRLCSETPSGLAQSLFLATVLAAGCGPDAVPGGDGITTAVDTVAGVIRVANTGTPPQWELTRVVSIGPRSLTAVESPEEFGRVTSAALGPDGALFIADDVNDEIKVFGLDGAHRRTFGRFGEGPGEFSGLYSLAWVGDRLLTLDFGVGRIGELSAEGAWLGQRDVPSGFTGSPSQLRFFPVGPDEAFAAGLRTGPAGLELVFVGHDSRGVTGDTLSYMRSPAAAGSTIICRYEGGISAFEVPFRPRLVQHPGGGGVMFVALTDAYRIAVTRGDGDTLRVIERTLPPEPVSDEEWAAANQAFEEFRADYPDASCDPRRPDRPDAKPFIAALHVAPDGRLWVEVVRTAGNRWELFDVKGRLLASLPVRPQKERAAPAFGSEHMVTIRRDSLDLDHVDVWRIDPGGR